MTYLKYYQEEKTHFPEEWKENIKEEQIVWFFLKFRNHYKFKHNLKLWGLQQRGRCSLRQVKVPRETTIGMLIHEISHAIQFKKDNYEWIKHRRFHSKQHLNIMKRLFKFYLKNRTKWNEQLERQ